MGNPHYLTEDEWKLAQLGYYTSQDTEPKLFSWWRDSILTPRGKPARHAIEMLSRLMFYQRPLSLRDQEGHPLPALSRSHDGYVHRTYEFWSEALYCSVSSVKRSVNLLLEMGLIYRAQESWSTESFKKNPVALKVLPDRVAEVLGTPLSPVVPKGAKVWRECDLGPCDLIPLPELVGFTVSHEPPEWYRHPSVQNEPNVEETPAQPISSFWTDGSVQNEPYNTVQNDPYITKPNEGPVGDTKESPGATRPVIEKPNKQTNGGAGRKRGLEETRREMEATPLRNLSEEEFSSVWGELTRTWERERLRNRLVDPISPLTLAMQRAYSRAPIDCIYGMFGRDSRSMVLAVLDRTLETRDPRRLAKYLERVSYVLSDFAEGLEFGDVDYWKGVYL